MGHSQSYTYGQTTVVTYCDICYTVLDAEGQLYYKCLSCNNYIVCPNCLPDIKNKHSAWHRFVPVQEQQLQKREEEVSDNYSSLLSRRQTQQMNQQGLEERRLEDRRLQQKYLDDRHLQQRYLDQRYLNQRYLEARQLQQRVEQQRVDNQRVEQQRADNQRADVQRANNQRAEQQRDNQHREQQRHR